MKVSDYKYNNGIELAREIITDVDKKVKRDYWTNEEIDRWFGRRSAMEIIENGTTCFMNPCWDLTLVSASEIYSRKVDYDFVIEENPPTKDFNFDKSNLVLRDFNFNRIHFAVEFKLGKRKYFLNYKRENEVHIFEGNYNGREDIPTMNILRIPGKTINPQKPIHVNLGYKTFEELIKNKFKGYSLEKNIERLKKDNSLENYEFYKKRYGENFNIIITPQNQLSL